MLPWLLPLVAIGVAWWRLSKRLRRIETALNQNLAIGRDHRREFLAFAKEQGWNDNLRLTQVLREDEIKWLK